MASALRQRRAIASDTPLESPTPRDESPASDGPEQPEEDQKIRVAHHHKKTRKRRTTAIFLLGSLFGIVVAGFFANSNDLINLPDIGELSMDSLLDVLPAGLVRDMRDLVVSCHPLPSALKAKCGVASLTCDTAERRTRLPRHLRCFLGWSQGPFRRHERCSPDRHDPRSNLHRSRVLGHLECLATLLSQTAMG
jgi:hypothetical protein